MSRTSDNRAYSCSQSDMLPTREWQYTPQCISRRFDEVLGKFFLSLFSINLMSLQDFRDPRNGARYRFEGKSESVRDVQFNPVSIYEFAAAFETGTIQASARAQSCTLILKTDLVLLGRER